MTPIKSNSSASSAVTPTPVIGPDVDAASLVSAELGPAPSTLFPQAKGESDRAFEAFRAYLELGPKRRYAAVGRKVGATLRTIKRWAADFDWRGRVKTCAAQSVEQYLQTENTVQREELLDVAARAKAFRDRQYALAEAILDAAERHLEQVEDDDLDQMSFSDACKALEVASRFNLHADCPADDPSAPARSLRDQLTALLDQVYAETPARNGADNPPPSPASPQPQS